MIEEEDLRKRSYSERKALVRNIEAEISKIAYEIERSCAYSEITLEEALKRLEYEKEKAAYALYEIITREDNYGFIGVQNAPGMVFFLQPFHMLEKSLTQKKQKALRINVHGELKTLLFTLKELEEKGTIDHVTYKQMAELFTVEGKDINPDSLKTIYNRDVKTES
jgi:hypothetical protein